MVSEDDIVKYALGLADVSERRDGALRIFTRGEKIFLVIETGTDPLRIETRCDRRLSKTLQEQYESVMESRALGRNGIEIICSGQLTDDEVVDLVRHSYEISGPEAE
ncbi:hypothetical protein J6X15_04180 [Candidatus Saccharibacteria bacterium]|nr:hypothetical protein [Candidatus Saccharibacteria bacterium]MBP5656752.1 hypothetical protein [Candidatus Saccharibacteria bacterium]